MSVCIFHILQKLRDRFGEMVSIIDAHVHLSEKSCDQLIRYAKLNGLEYTLREYLGIMKKLDIEKGLLLSPPILEDREPILNDVIIELCQRSEWKLCPVLTVEPSHGAVSKALALAANVENKVRAFKIRLGYRSVFAYNPIFDSLYDYAEMNEFPVLFHTGDIAMPEGSLMHSHPLTLDRLANKRKNLKIVACHFGNPWIEDVAELAYKHENIYADVSGLFAGGGKYGPLYLESVVRKISEAVYYIGNAEKIVFGSDYPVSNPSDILKLVKLLRITPRDHANILANNSKRLFKL